MSATTTATDPRPSAVRTLPRLFLVCTLLGSGFYVLTYLYRWEWNRALTAGLFFLAAEMALLGDSILARLRRLESRIGGVVADMRAPSTAVVAQLAATRPAGRDHFAWLRPNDRFGVFVPVLMGAGVVMSGLAWLVERLARMTAGPVLERRLAREITTLTIQLDESGLVPAPVDSRTAILLGPSRRMSERAA